MEIKKCSYRDIEKYVLDYYRVNRIIIDSFLENHIRDSNFYMITQNNIDAGYFAVFNGTKLTMFNVFAEYRNCSQELFSTARKYESVREAFIPTGDEFFLSHAVDNFVKMEKQAYFSVYTDKVPRTLLDLRLQLADPDTDMSILELCYDFLKEEIDNIRKGISIELYIARHGEDVIGFGVVEYQKIAHKQASIGMIVREEYRRKGYGANILHGLKTIVQGKGLTAVSGCWYYNHNSKKTMESAGAFSQTRLLNFFF